MRVIKCSLNYKQIVLIAAAVSLLAANAFGAGPVEKVIYSFGFADGTDVSELTADASGNLYGTTFDGGPCCGNVFKLTPPATTGGTWTKTTLYSFQGGADGSLPEAGVVLDKQGNLYGTAVANNGTVFELSPPSAPGGAWTETVLWHFDSGAPYGYAPSGKLTMDEDGNFYGTTLYGGTHNVGIVFELVAPKTSGGAWKERVLHNFGAASKDGVHPGPDLLLRGGYLYGTTSAGGASNCGTVFRLARKPGAWTETILHNFTGYDGDGPWGGVIADEEGNLYGTTQGGPLPTGQYMYGSVYELSPPADVGGAWKETSLHMFTDKSDGEGPRSALWRDKSGSLFGTAEYAGAKNINAGTAFKLNPPTVPGGDWTFIFLHTFGVTPGDGVNPYTGLTYADGVLYGATMSSAGGTLYYGTVYSIVP